MSSPDSDTNLATVPLPPSPPPEEDDEGESPSNIPIPDSLPLDEIPVPDGQHGCMDDEEIPLPPDSSKYSPSQATGEDEISESYEPVSSTASGGGASDPLVSSSSSNLGGSNAAAVKKVLDRAQAKKRLMAFSAAKNLAVTATSTSSGSSGKGRPSPLKGVTVFNPSKEKKVSGSEPQLAIESIKQEEIKLKEYIANNKLLSEKLKAQVSSTGVIPNKPPPITAIVNPTIVSLTDKIGVISGGGDSFSASDSLNTAANNISLTMKPPSSVSRNLRKRSVSSSPSPSRSHSPRDRRDRKRSRERDRDRGHGSSSSGVRDVAGRDRDRDRKRKSRSPTGSGRPRGGKRSKTPPSSSKKSSRRESKSPSPRRSSRRKSKSPKHDKLRRRSASRSKSPGPIKEKEKEKRPSSYKKSPSPSIAEKSKKSIRNDRSHSGSKSKSPELEKKSKVLVTRKSRSKSKSPKASRSSKKDRKSRRSRSKSEDREKEKRKRDSEQASRERRKEKEQERTIAKELDKVRKIRMPKDWTEYFKYQYTVDHIKDLYSKLLTEKPRKRSESRSVSPLPEAKGLSKSLENSSKTTSIDLNNGKEYPVFLVRKTQTFPSVSYGVNPNSFAGYYKTRKDVLREEEPEICQMMSEILKSLPTEDINIHSDTTKKGRGDREWFAANEQSFCPTESTKKVMISHLYSDEEMDSSPRPISSAMIKRKESDLSTQQKKFQSSGEGKEGEEEPEHDSLDSAPSPLLKKRYEGTPTKKSTSEVDIKHRSKRSPSSSDRELSKSSKSIVPSVDEEKKKIIESDDDDYLEMEADDFPLEKDSLQQSTLASTKEDKPKKDKSKDKEKKAKKQKKKKRKKSKKKENDSVESEEEESNSPEVEIAITSKHKRFDQKKDAPVELKINKKDTVSGKGKPKSSTSSKRKHGQRDKHRSKGAEANSSSESTHDSGDDILKVKKEQQKRPKLDEGPPTVILPILESSKSVIKKLEKEKTPEKEKAGLAKTNKREEKKLLKKLKKKNKHEEKSKRKRKHGKKPRSPSTSSIESEPTSDSDEDSDSSSSDAGSSSEDAGVTISKSKKRKVEKKKSDTKEKDKSVKEKSKKTKKRNKNSSSENEEEEIKLEKNKDKNNDRDKNMDRDRDRDGSRRRDDKDRNGGGAGGTGGNNSGRGGGGGERSSRNDGGDKRGRDNERDRDRRKNSDSGRRRTEGGFEELPLASWEVDIQSTLRINEERPRELQTTNTPLSFVTNSKKESLIDKIHNGKSMGLENVLSEFDDDLLLQSIMKNENLSSESIIRKLSVTNSTELPLDFKVKLTPPRISSSLTSVKGKVESTTTVSSSNWSDDSEDERGQEPSVTCKLALPELNISSRGVEGIEIQPPAILDTTIGVKLTPPPSVTTGAVSSSGYATGTESDIKSPISDSSSSDSSSSSSDSEDSSSDSSSSDNSSISDKGDKYVIDNNHTSGQERYDPFEAVMSQIAEVDKSTYGILTKVEEHNATAAAGLSIPVLTSSVVTTPNMAIDVSTIRDKTEINQDCYVRDLRRDDVDVRPKMLVEQDVHVDRSLQNHRRSHDDGYYHYHRDRTNDRGYDEKHRRLRSPSPIMEHRGVGHGGRSRYERDDRYRGCEVDRYRMRRGHHHRHPRSISRSRSRSGSRSRSSSPRSGNHYRHRDGRDVRYKFRDDGRVERDLGKRYRNRDRGDLRDWPEDCERYPTSKRRDCSEPGEFLDTDLERDRPYGRERDSKDYDSRYRDRGFRRRRDFMDYPDNRYERDRKIETHHESPPLQSNVADSTISDAELAANNQMGLLMHQYGPPPAHVRPGEAYDGDKNYPMFQYPMPFPPPITQNMETPLQHTGDADDMNLHQQHGYDCGSPPRRLSLDERLEMEMGIKLDAPKKWTGYQNPQGPYYSGNQFIPSGSSQGPIYRSDPGNLKTVPLQPQSQSVAYDANNSMTVHQQRQQCQILQLGNVLQVLPTEIPNGSFTISASLEVTQNGCSVEKVPPGTRRVVTIKVPVVPFSMAVVDRSLMEEMPRSVMKEKRKREKSKRRSSLKNRKHQINDKKDVSEEVDVDKENEKDDDGDLEENEGKNALVKDSEAVQSEQMEPISTAEEIKDEDVAERDDNDTENQISSIVGEDDVFTSSNISDDTTNTIQESNESKNLELSFDDKLIKLTENADDKDTTNVYQNEIVLTKKIYTVQLPLPEAGKGILVAVGFREKTIDASNVGIKKGVRFVDGINPGGGTESSEGEEMRSPPPPSIIEMEKKKLKKLKIKAAKRKERAKRKLQAQKDAALALTDDSEEPPPPPSTPFPFCHPGILYQVCPQYAVCYAQALAEKGFDIIFQGTHQIPPNTETLSIQESEPNLPSAEVENQPIEAESVVDAANNSANQSSIRIPLTEEAINISSKSMKNTSVLIELTSHYDVPSHSNHPKKPSPTESFENEIMASFNGDNDPPASPLLTPTYNLSPSSNNIVLTPVKNQPKGSPIPTLIRRTRSPPPQTVFPSSVLAETDIEGNSLLY